MAVQEVSYYQDPVVTITNARAVFRDKTFAMANITSVSMRTIPANRNNGIALAVLGVMMAGCSGIGGGSNNSGLGILLVFGILAVIGGIYLASAAKPSYVVRIGSASGETNGLFSADKDYVQNIVTALNEAIIKRG